MFSDYNTTSDGWLEWNGNQYYFNRRSMAMEEARHYCQQKHSDLVSITTEAEAVFVWKQVSNDFYSDISIAMAIKLRTYCNTSTDGFYLVSR